MPTVTYLSLTKPEPTLIIFAIGLACPQSGDVPELSDTDELPPADTDIEEDSSEPEWVPSVDVKVSGPVFAVISLSGGL
jgi:hypothetical protein